MKKSIKLIIMLLIIALAVGIGFISQMKEKEVKANIVTTTNETSSSKNNISDNITTNTTENQKVIDEKVETKIENKSETKVEEKVENKKEETKTETEATKKNEVSEENKVQSKTEKKGKTVAIDPGHQRTGDSSKEPIGPGASEMKAKVTTGATGVSTKQLESELNLKVSLQLKEELEKRGYTVIMTRTTQDVNLSNSQRAEIANNANADAFVRIHADSYDQESVQGISTLCQTEKNKYNGNLAKQSYNLSKSIVDNMVKQTGAKNRGVTKTDNMSGINWAKVPTSIVEMGFLSNINEDKLLASADYQKKIVQGIANGIDEFLK